MIPNAVRGEAMIAQLEVNDTEWLKAEVSGWDRTGGYFVERTEVRFERNDLLIRLRRAMAPRAVLFVRRMLAHGVLESEPRLMQVTRSRRHKPEGYLVRCRPPKNGRTPSRRGIEIKAF